MANEKRLIDANKLLERILSLTLTVIGLRAEKGVLLELLNIYRNGILQLVNEQPAVDAVEVVRCGKCSYCENGKCFHPKLENGWNSEGGEHLVVKISDFCSYGERKDNE